MCRRFSLTADLEEIQQYFQIDKVMVHYKNRYNIAPTQEVSVVLSERGERCLDSYRWGFFPFWGRDAINADFRSVEENPAYRKMVDRQRCVIPCSGMYYWKEVGRKRYPVRVVMRSGNVFGIAGFYEVWRDTRKEEFRTFTILTTDPNPLIREFDRRMPVILERDAMEEWLDTGITDKRHLHSLMKSYDVSQMLAYPVSPIVSNEWQDNSECVEKMDVNLAWVKE
ncbi:hypothetical protein PAE9249_04153 [Paenibacillus sp. CECT 9249]|uniref:SOS response-associated peptidase n=1 Tax=Paenibacillus sp. CECT 9249 TaxID=2845385 RepID=UPI001E5DFB2E|nr:SOS response-associated peptidase [Paenibacillus sp. CECT 9249]CAH0121621.1 hypothetical protein PAE9249_04153 [Paenibacillus sp. CECT 9249]